MAILAGYVRVSSLCQKDNTSFQVQCDMIEAYAKLHGHEIVFVGYDVESASGEVKRPGLDFVLNKTKTGQVDGVICAKLDRFARSVQDGLNMATELRKTGKQLVIIDLHLDTADIMGEFIYTVFLAIAQLERKTIQKRTNDGLDKVRELGGYVQGNPGYGYTSAKAPDGRRCKLRVPVPEEQRWIQQMLQWRDQGWTYPRIADELNKLAIPGKRGAKWIKVTVRQIILRERHASGCQT